MKTKTKTKKRRFLGILLSLALVIGVMPVLGLSQPAHAKEADIPEHAYNISVSPAKNGKVKADKDTAREGDTVTLTTTPDKNYKLKELGVTALREKVESLEEMVSLMGDAVFNGYCITETPDYSLSSSGYTIKIKDGAFSSYQMDEYPIDTLNISDATFDTSKSGQGEYSAITDSGIKWNFELRNGKIVKISHYQVGGDTTFSFYGESNGSLPSIPVKTTTIKKGEKYSFTMPAANVTVSAEFEYDKQAPKPEPKAQPQPKPAKVSGTLIAKMTARGKTKFAISWNKVEGASGFEVFFAKCNSKGKDVACKKVKNIKGNMIFKWTKSGLKNGTPYKAYVKAYVKKDGKKKYVSKSPIMHAYTGNGTKKYTNAKSVKLNKNKVTLKKGKSFKIKAKVTKVKKRKKLMPKKHAATVRYLSTNKKVATVSKNGKIKAAGKGTCDVYAYAHNGAYKKINVKVK